MAHSLVNVIPGVEMQSATVEQKILVERVKGRTLTDIGAELGIAPSTVQYHEQKILRRLAEENTKTADEYRALITERLEFALRGLAPLVEAGKPFAVEKWVMILDRLMRLYLPDAAKPSGGITVNNFAPGSAPMSSAEYVTQLLQKIISPQNIIEGEVSSISLDDNNQVNDQG